MKVCIQPSVGSGVITAPPSKSITHRLLIGATLAQGESLISNVSFSQDILATIEALKALGAVCEIGDHEVRITWPIQFHKNIFPTIDCHHSGSTLRFCIPLSFCCDETISFTGSEALFARPLWVYEELCKERGLIFEKQGRTLTVGGELHPGEFSLPGDVSSQFISGLLFVLPLLADTSIIRLTTAIESKPYMDMTMGILKGFGVESFWQDDRTILVPGAQQYHGGCHTVEGDYSNAAVFMALKYLGHPITLQGLSSESLQGDQVAEDCFKALSYSGAEIDLSQCPDLGPVLFAFAALLKGGIFLHTRRLRLKESDRIQAMVTELAKMNIRCLVEEDRVIIPGDQSIQSPKVPLEGHNDHRIVMALSMILTQVGGEINGAEAVAKSYPDFFEQMQKSGYHVEIFS